MYDWSQLLRQERIKSVRFSCCWKDVRLKLIRAWWYLMWSFSCCWKDVRLKLSIVLWWSLLNQFQLLLKGCTIEASFSLRSLSEVMFQLLLKGCTIEAFRLIREEVKWLSFSCCWKDVRLKLKLATLSRLLQTRFSCCWKDVRLKQRIRACFNLRNLVSVVVERMYDWSPKTSREILPRIRFSCCWKDVRLKLQYAEWPNLNWLFQLLLKGCTIEARDLHSSIMLSLVSVVVERMYDWSSRFWWIWLWWRQFQLLLKGCTIEARYV